MTKQEVIEQMIKQAKDETGFSIDQLKARTKIVNEYGTRSGETKFSTFSLVYTGNENFCNGISNGYGAGWYFKARFILGCGVNYLKIK